MRTTWPKIALLILCCAALAFELWHFRSKSPSQEPHRTIAQKNKPDFALLPASEIAGFSKDYLVNPKIPVASWEPTLGDINDLESDLSQISALSEKLKDANRRIDDPKQYFRQLLAIRMDDKNLIFVNALCRPHPDWRKHLLVVLDGGKCFWQGTYDPSARTFSNLIVNGVA
jgi:hypothetical protein